MRRFLVAKPRSNSGSAAASANASTTAPPAPVRPHSAQLEPNANPQFGSTSTATPAESLAVRDAAVAAATAAATAADNSTGLGTTEPLAAR